MIGLIVPTLNAGDAWRSWIQSLKSQSLMPDRVLIMDSSSDDDTVMLAKQAGFEVANIRRSEFNHGTTRQLAAEILADAEILIYLTQDALLADSFSLENLIRGLADSSVGAAYGRQLPHLDAGPIGSHARLFNYGENSEVRSLTDRRHLGIKCAFLSNSFSAYRRKALTEVGGFPSNTILGEDSYVGAKMLLAGWKVAYCADSIVRHSHDYSLIQEFKRYFDIGVFHSREQWIRNSFGGAEGEGRRYVISEISYLLHQAPWHIPSVIARTGLKYFGYRLGLVESRLPVSAKRNFSMHRLYWK